MAEEEEAASDCPFGVHVQIADTFWTKKLFAKALASYSKVRQLVAAIQVWRSYCTESNISPRWHSSWPSTIANTSEFPRFLEDYL